uniref:Uncharacterized protein n=1 Tax=Sus scrofa TaxID=9823 RepID=A0A8D0RV55_PIG
MEAPETKSQCSDGVLGPGCGHGLCDLVYMAHPLKVVVALFTIGKTWKQLKCPLTDEWIKKTWYIYTVEYYSAIKKNKIMPFAVTWMQLGVVILSQSATERQIPYDITYMWNLK